MLMHQGHLKKVIMIKIKENVCSSQRDILSEGIKQSKLIGSFVLDNNINIEKVIVSPTCRTYKTAKYEGN